jgi:hypothetical protein
MERATILKTLSTQADAIYDIFRLNRNDIDPELVDKVTIMVYQYIDEFEELSNAGFNMSTVATSDDIKCSMYLFKARLNRINPTRTSGTYDTARMVLMSYGAQDMILTQNPSAFFFF